MLMFPVPITNSGIRLGKFKIQSEKQCRNICLFVCLPGKSVSFLTAEMAHCLFCMVLSLWLRWRKQGWRKRGQWGRAEVKRTSLYMLQSVTSPCKINSVDFKTQKWACVQIGGLKGRTEGTHRRQRCLVLLIFLTPFIMTSPSPSPSSSPPSFSSLSPSIFFFLNH